MCQDVRKPRESKTKYPYEDEMLPVWCAPIVLGVAILLFYATYKIYNDLPQALQSENQGDNPDRFIAENAQLHLRNITSLGARVGGSLDNDEGAPQILLKILQVIKAEMLHTVHTLDIKTQFEFDDMDFQQDFKPYGMTTVFKGCFNVLAKLTPKDSHPDYSGKCILLNSHFDTTPDSDGASDAAAMVAIMLEVLRVMSSNPEPYKHCLVFLFNGGAENYMLGSYSFIKHNMWANDVAIFLNLDAVGAGGREIIYQADSKLTFLMYHYSQVAPHPHASVMVEELFQNHLRPLDSDYRIFRDFAEIGGLDFVYYANGYVHQTKYDKAEIIPLGTYQHTGDNILALTKSLATSNELYNVTQYSGESAVFFDIFGWTMLYYTQSEAILINALSAAIGLLVLACCLKSMSTRSGLTIGEVIVELLICVGCHLVGICFGTGVTLLLAIIYDAVGRSMSWYSSPWLLFGLYMCPFLITVSLPVIVWADNFKRGILSTSHQVQLYIHAHFLLLLTVLIVVTAMNIRSAYILLVSVIFQTSASLLNWISGLQNKAKSWTIIQLVAQVIPVMFHGSCMYLTLQTIIPMTGRDGPDSSPEILIASVSIAIALLMAGFIMPLVALCRLKKAIMGMFGVIWTVAVILMATTIGFPYRSETSPQRFRLLHTNRIYHGIGETIERAESGYFIEAMDRHTPMVLKDLWLESLRSSQEDCDIALYCGLPLRSSREHSKSEFSFWIPADIPPVVTAKTTLELIHLEIVSPRERIFSFQTEGPPHSAIFLSPAENMQMTNWSYLENNIPESGPTWQNGRSTYFVSFNYAYGMPARFSFEITIALQGEFVEKPPAKWLDIALVSHYLFHKEQRTTNFEEFINTFPEWSYVQAWPSTYESWQF